MDLSRYKQLKIKDVFSGDLTKTSFGYVGKCPFHNDSNPSFQITEKKTGDLFYCHGCKMGGDVISFVREREKLTLKQALSYIGSLLGIENVEIINKYSSIEKILKYHDFLRDKGISEDVCKKFGIGYIDDISKYNIDQTLLMTSGVGLIKDSIFYSIKDRVGETLGYSVRPLSQSGGNKYITHSSLPLFGLNQLKNSNFVIGVEGFNDVLALQSNGIHNVVGLNGTNFNTKTFSILKEHKVKKLIIIPDFDAGGLAFKERIIANYGNFDTFGVQVFYAMLPESGDPDEYVKKNRDFFLNVDKIAINLVRLKCEQLRQLNYDDVSIVNTILDEMPKLPQHEIALSLKGLIDVNVNIKKTFCDFNCERIVLANAIKDVVCRNYTINNVKSDFFVIPECKSIFNLIASNEKVTFETIENEYKVVFDRFDTNNYQYYTEKLFSLYKKREFIKLVEKFDYNLLEKNDLIEPLISNLISGISEIIKESDIVKTVTSDIVFLDTKKMIDEDSFDGISYGDKMPIINDLTRGLPKTNFFIIAAGTGVGKTTFALNIVDSVLIQGYKTLILSAEMTPEDLMLRQLSIRLGVAYNDIINKRVDYNYHREELLKLINKNVVYAKFPLAEETYNFLQWCHTKHDKFDFVVYDYLGKAMTKTKNSKFDMVNETSNMLKNFALDYNLPVMALAQQNRNDIASKKSGKENIAKSYEMIGDADVAIFLKNVENDNPIKNGNLIANLDKVRRNSSSHLKSLYFDPSCLRMKEV